MRVHENAIEGRGRLQWGEGVGERRSISSYTYLDICQHQGHETVIKPSRQLKPFMICHPQPLADSISSLVIACVPLSANGLTILHLSIRAVSHLQSYNEILDRIWQESQRKLTPPVLLRVPNGLCFGRRFYLTPWFKVVKSEVGDIL